MNEKECCPRFDPAPWDCRIVEWKDKKFLKDSVLTFFYIPLNFGSVMTRIMTKMDKAGAMPPDYLCLSEHTSKWRMDIYLALDKDVPGAEMTTLSGKYLFKVYEGPFSKTGEWVRDFNAYAKAQGHTTGRQFSWYTTCPKCAKKWGKNYVVLVAEEK